MFLRNMIQSKDPSLGCIIKHYHFTDQPCSFLDIVIYVQPLIIYRNPLFTVLQESILICSNFQESQIVWDPSDIVKVGRILGRRRSQFASCCRQQDNFHLSNVLQLLPHGCPGERSSEEMLEIQLCQVATRNDNDESFLQVCVFQVGSFNYATNKLLFRFVL